MNGYLPVLEECLKLLHILVFTFFYVTKKIPVAAENVPVQRWFHTLKFITHLKVLCLTSKSCATDFNVTCVADRDQYKNFTLWFLFENAQLNICQICGGGLSV